MKKTLKIIGIVLLAVLVLAGSYVAYVFAAYHRIEDNQKLAVVSGQTQTARAGERTVSPAGTSASARMRTITASSWTAARNRGHGLRSACFRISTRSAR